MIDVNLKALLGRLNATCATSLSTAAALCIGRGHYEITPEHHVEALLDEPSSDLSVLCERFGVERATLRRALQDQLSGLRSGNPGKPVFSPLLMEWYSEAWLLGSVEQGLGELRSGLLLLTLLWRPDRYASPGVARVLRALPRENLRENLATLARSGCRAYS